MPRIVVEKLREFGHDVLTIYEDGKGNQRFPDDLVLEVAIELGRAVITINRKDFRRLHLQYPVHAGIILCIYDPDFQRQAQRIHEELGRHESMAGRLIKVNRPG